MRACLCVRVHTLFFTHALSLSPSRMRRKNALEKDVSIPEGRTHALLKKKVSVSIFGIQRGTRAKRTVHISSLFLSVGACDREKMKIEGEDTLRMQRHVRKREREREGERDYV